MQKMCREQSCDGKIWNVLGKLVFKWRINVFSLPSQIFYASVCVCVRLRVPNLQPEKKVDENSFFCYQLGTSVTVHVCVQSAGLLILR